MLAALVIVFREVLEAGLVVGIVLAATKGMAGRGRFVALGIAAGILGAAIVAIFAGQISALFEGSGQELFNAAILLVAVAMLAWHNAWMASHGREIAAHTRDLSVAVETGRRPPYALSVVVGLAVLREGAEVVLFLTGIAASEKDGGLAMAAGGALGVAGGAVVSALLYAGLLSIPARSVFSVTSGLITLLAAGMAAQAMLFLEQGGYADTLDTPLWSTRRFLAEDSLAGRLLHTLIGYSDSPTGLQLLAYAITIFVVIGLMRLENARRFKRGNAPT